MGTKVGQISEITKLTPSFLACLLRPGSGFGRDFGRKGSRKWNGLNDRRIGHSDFAAEENGRIEELFVESGHFCVRQVGGLMPKKDPLGRRVCERSGCGKKRRKWVCKYFQIHKKFLFLSYGLFPRVSIPYNIWKIGGRSDRKYYCKQTNRIFLHYDTSRMELPGGGL